METFLEIVNDRFAFLSGEENESEMATKLIRRFVLLSEVLDGKQIYNLISKQINNYVL